MQRSTTSMMSYGLALSQICRDDAMRRELQWIRACCFDDATTKEHLRRHDPTLPDRMKGYLHEMRVRGFDPDDARGRRDGWSWAFEVHFEKLQNETLTPPR